MVFPLKPVSRSVPLPVRLFGLLLLVGVAAFFLASVWTNSTIAEKNFLVIGRAAVSPPTTPARIAPAQPPSIPSSGAPGDWTLVLPAGAIPLNTGYGGKSSFVVGNNGQFIALLYKINPTTPAWYLNVYRSADGQLLQTVAFPAGTYSVLLQAARDADMIGVLYEVRNGTCSTSNPSSIFLSKYTSTSHVFTNGFTPSGCPTSFQVNIAPTGTILAGYSVPQKTFRRYSASNTSGTPDAVFSGTSGVNGGALANGYVSGDLHYAQYTYLPLSHRVYDIQAAPEIKIFDTLVVPANATEKIGISLNGGHAFECKGVNGDPTTRVVMFRPNPNGSGTTDAYIYTLIDELPNFQSCDLIHVSDDGQTLYLYYHAPTDSSRSNLRIYHAKNGDLFKRVSDIDLSTILTTYPIQSTTSDGKYELAFFYSLASTHGHDGMVQLFERGKDVSIQQFEIAGEEIGSADLFPDGSKIALSTCAPTMTTCTTARVRVYDLSLIPTNVRGSYLPGSVPRITLTWDSLPGALSYTVFRGTVDDSRAAVNMGTGILGTQWVDHQVVPGQTYYYWVKMRDTLTHYFSGSARVFAGATSPNAPQPCLINGAVLNTDGTCTLKIPASVSGTGKIEVTGANSWAQVQNAASGTNVMLGDVRTEAYSASTNSGSTTYSGGRVFMHANLPLLPPGISIQSVGLRIAPGLHSSPSTGSANTYNVVASTQANPNALSAADYSRVNLSPLNVYASLTPSSFTSFNQATFAFTSAGKSAVQAASGNVFQFALVPGYHLAGGTYPPASSGSTLKNTTEFMLPYAYYYSYSSAAPPTIDITYTV